MLSFPLHFILSGNANSVTGLYHSWRFGDNIFTINNCKNIFVALIIIERIHLYVSENNVAGEVKYRRRVFAISTTTTLVQVQTSSKFVTQ